VNLALVNGAFDLFDTNLRCVNQQLVTTLLIRRAVICISTRKHAHKKVLAGEQLLQSATSLQLFTQARGK
jgi:hypothetical protein